MSTPIDVKHTQLAQAGFGFGNSAGGEGICPDGAGHFRHWDHGSIYWTPATGAHVVYGLIRAKWSAMGWERSPLGYPTTDEGDAVAGRYNDFQYGTITWKQGAGEAFAVYGAIGGKWISLGHREGQAWNCGLLGFPVTDETGTPDGIGRYNHFEAGSIYWTPGTGAWEVHGDIRAKWASLGWEKSFLRYPVSDEKDTPDHSGRVSVFQGGFIYWTPQQGAWVTQSGQGIGASGSISGQAFGPGLGQVKVFSVSLSGPNDRHLHKGSKPFDAAGHYSFTGLPAGRYWVSVDTKADTWVSAHPREKEVDCAGGPLTQVDFELQ